MDEDWGLMLWMGKHHNRPLLRLASLPSRIHLSSRLLGFVDKVTSSNVHLVTQVGPEKALELALGGERGQQVIDGWVRSEIAKTASPGYSSVHREREDNKKEERRVSSWGPAGDDVMGLTVIGSAYNGGGTLSSRPRAEGFGSWPASQDLERFPRSSSKGAGGASLGSTGYRSRVA
jgi:hypothetical protein